MREKVLLYANTSFHTEVLLCLYGILKINNYEPLIYIQHNVFGVLDLLNKHNIPYITKYNSNLKNIFNKIFYISMRAKENIIHNFDENIAKDFENRSILIVHRPSYYNQQEILQRYGNIKPLGLSPFAQRFNMDYLFGMDNVISQNINPRFKINNKVKLLLIGRFLSDDRYINIFPEIYNKNLNFKRDFEISIIGEHADKCYEVKNDFNIKFNLNEIDFYNEIISSDFIINLFLGDYSSGFYFERISSNYGHILSFKKPQICHYLSNIISNTPALSFEDEKSFYSTIQEAVNISEEKYEQMVKNFNLPIENYRNHNKYILNKII